MYKENAEILSVGFCVDVVPKISKWRGFINVLCILYGL